MMKNSYLCINAKKCIFFVKVHLFRPSLGFLVEAEPRLNTGENKRHFWPRCTFLGDRTNYKAKDIIGNITHSFVFIYLLRNQAIQNHRNSFSRGFPLPFNVETLQAFEALFQILHYCRKFLYCKPKYHLLHALPNRFVPNLFCI
jgi:hypothetical protein